MEEPIEQKIARLMAEGLDHYGQDRVDQAVECWRAELELNGEHRVARDYLDAAGFAPSPVEAAPVAQAAAPPAARRSVIEEVMELLDQDLPAEALEMLETQADAPEPLEAQAMFDLVRSSLYGQYRRRAFDGRGVPGVRLGPDKILEFNLPAQAGFLLSMIDGNTSVDDLVALAGMEPFEALHMLAKLMDAGIVEVEAA